MDQPSLWKVAVTVLVALPIPVASFATIPSSSTVNAVLGDESFVKLFGVPPGPATDEDLRIRTHLAYVEALLAARDVSSWPRELQAARRRNLDRLHRYWTRGIFPRNHDYPGTRKPCFIDRDGRLCAVGYLIEQSVGRNIAETINSRFQYELIGGMQSQALEQWIADSGLTKQEIAIVQPCYGCPKQILCMRITGRTWSPSHWQPGEELHLVGTISPTDGMFSHIPTSEELTLYLGPAVFDEYNQWENGATYDYRGGTFAVYEDPSFNAQFGVDPPNDSVPGTFVDGTPWVSGQVSALTISYSRVAGTSYYYLSGGLHVSGGAHAHDFLPPGADILGPLTSAAIQGFDFLWEGELYGFCGPTPVEPVTWGGIKAQYR